LRVVGGGQMERKAPKTTMGTGVTGTVWEKGLKEAIEKNSRGFRWTDPARSILSKI